MKKVHNKDGSVDIIIKRESLSTYVIGSIISVGEKEVVIRVRGSAENLKNVLIEKAILENKLHGNRVYKNGEPCEHPGCLAHFSHPCEGCGRIGGRAVMAPLTNPNKKYKIVGEGRIEGYWNEDNTPFTITCPRQLQDILLYLLNNLEKK